MTGQIPDLASLQTLFFLELSGNQLSGEIPASLGSLDELRVLDLQDNDLTGEIPAELGTLTRADDHALREQCLDRLRAARLAVPPGR